MRSNSTASEPPSTAETSRVLNSSRAFLSEWLLPDLDLADKKLISMKEERTNYINLRRILQTLLRERSLDSKSTSASQFTSRQLDLAGNGKENEKLDLKVSKNEKPILNLGQNVFLAMEPMEGIEFVEKKLEILDRRLVSQAELVAQIEAHIHLTSTSLSQLEALHSGESESLLDGLSAM